MENYVYQCTADNWEHSVYVSAVQNKEVPVTKHRCQANARERDRTLNSVNMAFTTLRQLIPTEPRNRKLSKIEILRLAGSYITHLDNQLYTGEMDQPCLLKTNEVGTSVCTFCWSNRKKENAASSPNSYYKGAY